MTGEQLDEKAIFNVARGINSPLARAEYLAQACGGDGNLAARIETLLRGYEEQASFLESPAVSLTSAADLSAGAERPGAIIGSYKLVQQIGEGGFGVVFLAEQEKPVRRRVAIKVVKPGMDTREVIARFEAERQALALMDHPNIARVYEAGATDSGRPYFVMELVRGVPITDYCDECRLQMSERLELFVAVCQAVQHAHQKSVIHRDLKPTNVLVMMQDGRPAPKIIDFGVAKAIGGRLTEHTVTTAFAQMIGTPMYMSPEQAELSPLGVDTRSDIYSLGVMLYELLAGSTPFDKERLHAASYDELRRIIREEEPPRPSARVSTLAAELATTVAERRRTDARRLSQTVCGELDWIVMKCLEKDRNRRYDSAGSLARDVQRYGADEPVQACPPSASYRLRKFVRRNKVATAFGGVLVAAVAALTVSNVQTWRSQRQAAAESAKARAISDFLQDMLRAANPDEAKSAQLTVQQILDEASARLGDQLSGDVDVEAALRATIGQAYWRLGAADKAEPHLTRALELRRDLFGDDHELVAASLVDLAWCREEQGRLAEAEAAARDALQIFRNLGIVGPPVLRAHFVLQVTLTSAGRYEEAQKTAHEALAQARSSDAAHPELANILHHLAQTNVRLGRLREAEQAAREAVDMHRRWHPPGHPETAWGLYVLGSALQKQNKLTEAEDAFREALTIFRQRYRDDHFSLSSAKGSLRQVLTARDDQSALKALDDEEAKRSADPNDDVRLASLLLNNDPNSAQKTEARRLIRRAMDRFGQVEVEHASDLIRRVNAMNGYLMAIQACAGIDDFARDVDELNRRFAEEIRQLPLAFPDSSDCQWWTGLLCRGWGAVFYTYDKHLPLAEGAFLHGIDVFDDQSLADSTQRPGAWLYLADSYLWLVDVQWRLGKLDEAQDSLRRAMEIYDEHSAELVPHTFGNESLDVVIDYIYIAYFLAATQRDSAAAEYLRKATLAASRLTEPVYAASAYFYLGFTQLRLGDHAGYQATCKALADLPFATASDLTKVQSIWTWCYGPDAFDDMSLVVKRAEEHCARNPFGNSHCNHLLGAALLRAGHYDRAAELLERSIDVYPSDPPPLPGAATINFQRLLLAMAKWRQGERDEARRWLAEAQQGIDQEYQPPAPELNFRITVEVLRREAEELIKPNDEEFPNNDSPREPLPPDA